MCNDFYSVSKRLLRMTIHNGPVVSDRDRCQAGNKRNTLKWDLSPDEIRTMTDSLINRVKKVYDDIGSLNIEDVSVENTLKALANAKLDYACKSLKETYGNVCFVIVIHLQAPLLFRNY